jgi:hypothetical protein
MKKNPLFNPSELMETAKENSLARLGFLETALKQDSVHSCDVIPKCWKLLWEIYNKDSTSFYSFFGKDLGCNFHTLEGMENIRGFLHNLIDDSYIKLKFLPNEEALNNRAGSLLKTKVRPYAPSFSLAWAGDSDPAIIYEKEMVEFLEFILVYVNSEAPHKVFPSMIINPLSFIKNWSTYPKQFKEAFDDYCSKNSDSIFVKEKDADDWEVPNYTR